MFLSIGGRIGYWQGKLEALVDDIAAMKPTIFIGVPRVFDRIYNGINDKIAGAGCLKKVRLFCCHAWDSGRDFRLLPRGVRLSCCLAGIR